MAWKHRTVAQELQVVGLSGRHCRREISELTGLGEWSVYDIQRKYHVVQRFGQSSSSAHFRYRYDRETWERVILLLYYEERLPLVEVAQRCGIAVSTLTRRMASMGLEVRSTGESNRGTKRGPYRTKLPRCEQDCGRGVAKAGESRCAICRKKVRSAG